MDTTLNKQVTKARPSSATDGFFQSLPTVLPQYSSQRLTQNIASQGRVNDDPVLSKILALYLPNPLPEQVDRHLHDLARECLSLRVLRWSVDAEVNVPTLHPLATFGTLNEVDALRTGEGWRQLKDFGIKNGTVALGYSTLDGQQATWNRRLHQMAVDHLWAGSAALVTCPAAMTDGAAILLQRHIEDEDRDQPGRSKVLQEARRRLISFDPSYAWTSGQWMTERSGGSDISQTETVATKLNSDGIEADFQRFNSSQDDIGCALGPWEINGFKWFSSATDADMVVLLARTEKGLSTFFAPMRRMKANVSVMNGVRISRLKNKLGTKALPTAEVEIKGMRGWLVGNEGEGVKEIASILNATRVWTACGAVAGWARGLAVARAYARVRKVRNALLQDNSQHVAWMATESVKYRASSHLAFLGVALLGVLEQGRAALRDTWAAKFLPTDRAETSSLLRLLVPVMKAQCSLAAVNGLRECMESLGGLGYCENQEDGGVLNIARIFRDTNVNPIWEGTVSVMVEDVVRVLKGKDGQQSLGALDKLITRLAEISGPKFDQELSAILVAYSGLRREVEDSSASKLHYTGRALLGGLENVLCSLLLMADAMMDCDPTSAAVVSRWMSLRYPHSVQKPQTNWQDDAAMDKVIFLGGSSTAKAPRENRL